MKPRQPHPQALALVRFCEKIFLPGVQRLILGIIIFNALLLGLETSQVVMAKAGKLLVTLDTFCLGFFVVEIAMKLVVLRFTFFRSAWNIFDFLIIGISLLPSAGPLSILRSLRVLRVLRLVANLPRLRMIIESILLSLPSIGWISALLLIVFYIFSVLVTTLFGHSFPEWFGSLGSSMYTLFQMLTLDSWSSGITRPIMKQFPYAWMLFVPFVLISAFIVLNVFIGIIVSAMGEVAAGKKDCPKPVGGEGKTEGASQPGSPPDTRKNQLARELKILKLQIDKVEKLLAVERPPAEREQL